MMTPTSRIDRCPDPAAVCRVVPLGGTISGVTPRGGVDMMTDREVSAGCVVAWLLWGGTVLVFVVGWVVDVAPLRTSAMLVCGAAVTATIRTYFVNQNRMMRNAFNLGRDSVDDRVR